MNPLLSAALEYHGRGWSVLPIGSNKKPAVRSWKEAQTERADEQTLRAQFANPGVTGVAAVCGPVSNGLNVRDFDDAAPAESWSKAYPGLAALLPIAQTARGTHVYCSSGLNRIIACGDGEMRGAGYVLLPPSLHPSGVYYRWINPPTGDLPIVDDLVAAGLVPECHRSKLDSVTQLTNCYRSHSSVTPLSHSPLLSHSSVTLLLCHTMEEAIRQTQPNEVGERERCVFEFARFLRGMPDTATADVADLEPYVRRWHNAAAPNIGTKPFADTWRDFVRGWGQVKHPRGQGLPVGVLADADAASDAYDDRYAPDVRRLIRVCIMLQRKADPFFLSCRTAAAVMGTDHMTASRRLSALVDEHVLAIAEKSTPHRATRYTYVGTTHVRDK